MNLNTPPFTLSFGGSDKSRTMNSRLRQWEQRQRFWEAVKQCHNRDELKAVLSKSAKDEQIELDIK